MDQTKPLVYHVLNTRRRREVEEEGKSLPSAPVSSLSREGGALERTRWRTVTRRARSRPRQTRSAANAAFRFPSRRRHAGKDDRLCTGRTRPHGKLTQPHHRASTERGDQGEDVGLVRGHGLIGCNNVSSSSLRPSPRPPRHGSNDEDDHFTFWRNHTVP